MARKTAIRITNEEIRQTEATAAARRDQAADQLAADREPTVIEIVRAARDQMTPGELLSLARKAARLELRGSFTAEDRTDCAGHIVWSLMAEAATAAADISINGMPRRSSQHATLSYACGLARNWRRSQLRRLAHEARVRQAEEDRYAMSAAAATDAIDTYSPAYQAAAAAQSVEAAAELASDIIARLDLPAGGAVWSLMYQWARGETGVTCAAELGIGAAAWRKRISRAEELMSGIVGARHLMDALTGGQSIETAAAILWSAEDQSRPATRSPGWTMVKERAADWREGTASTGARAPMMWGGVEDIRPEKIDRELPRETRIAAARAACQITHVPAAPRRAREDAETRLHHQAEALTRLARVHAQSSRREAKVQPTDVRPFGA